MGVSSAIFESAGQRTEHYVPGAYSRSYNVSSSSGVNAGNLVILGKSTGGKPATLLEFGSIAEAKDSLVSGELLEAVAYAFSGSNTYVPQHVYAMRVNDGTQANLTLKTGSTDLLKVSAWDYGVHTNQLKMMISDGTSSNSKKVSVVYKDKSETIDNIQKKSMSILYYGSGESATVTISNDSMTLTSDATEDNLTISFADFETLEAVVAKINDSDVYQATLIDTDSSAKSSDLDTVTSIDITGDGATLYSNFVAFIKALKTISLIGSIEVLATSTRTVPDNSNAYQYFVDGTAGSYTVSQWTTALEALELENVQIIATPSTDNAVQTLIANHCTQMSTTVNRKERTCILGGSIGESDTDAIAKATAFNNKLVSYICDYATAANPLTGDTETISGAMLGVMLAGMESGMAVNMPLTFKTINVLGFGKVRTISNMEKLIQAGIMVCNPNPENLSSYICIRALTTYQNDDLISNERSMVREDLYMNRDLRSRFVNSIGMPNGGSTNSIIQTLKDTAQEWATSGYIIPSESNENVWNISVKINGDKIYLTFSRYLTAPTNFVFITAVNHVYTSSVSL